MRHEPYNRHWLMRARAAKNGGNDCTTSAHADWDARHTIRQEPKRCDARAEAHARFEVQRDDATVGRFAAYSAASTVIVRVGHTSKPR